MSFVLDAQRRQEAGADPDSAARQAYEEAAAGSGRSLRLLLALLAILALAAVIGWWWLYEAEGQPQNSNGRAPSPQTNPEPPRGAPGISPTATVRAAPDITPPPKAMPAALPAGDRNALASFGYSSHIYGSDVQGRRLVVDGRTLSMGTVHRGWRLVAIEEDGVIWESGNERVTVPVLEMWGEP